MNENLLEVGIWMFVAMGGVNAFFIKGLIQKIDKVDRATTKYEEQINQLRQHIDQFASFVKELSDLKSDVAVLKFSVENDKRGK